MSRVVLEVERALERKVVVKVLSPDLAAGMSAERFRREVQLAACSRSCSGKLGAAT